MKQVAQLGILSAANIGIGFFFQWYVLVQLGPGLDTDALFAATTVPQLVLTVISASLMHVLVPLLAGEEEETLRHNAWAFLVLVAGLFGVLAVLLFGSAPWWVPLSVPGFSSAGQDLTVALTRIQLVGMVFAAVNGVQWAAYHARQRFLWAEFTPIISNVVALVILAWTLPRYGVVAAAWVGTMRMGLQTILLSPGMGRPAWPNLRSEAVAQTWRRIKPLLIATTYYKTDPLVDRILLSAAGSGSLSLYYLAQQLYGAANQILNKAIASPLVPHLSRLHKAGKTAELRHAYRRTLLQVGAICVAAVVSLALIGRPVLAVLMEYGNVSASNTTDLWWMMIWLAGMFVGGAMGQITSSTFYACGDTTTPTRMSIYTYSVYIPAKVAVFYVAGVKGLALVTSAYLLTNLLLQIYLLKAKRIV